MIHHIFRTTIKGCKYLPEYGYHPGTVMFVSFTVLGAIMGASGGWIGALIGGSITFTIFGVLYFSGAYDRGKKR